MSCPPSLKTVCVEILEGQRGPQGVQGIQGATGPTGPAGASGLSVKGDTGEASTVSGPQGATGASGLSVKGDTGERGEKGSTGQQGIQGIQGLQGLQGNEGATGASGARGSTGPVGASGLSIVGNTGATGLQGPSGVPSTVSGPQGNTGATGLSVTGATGSTGPAGDRYLTTSTTALTNATTGLKSMIVSPGLSLTAPQPIIVYSNGIVAEMHGEVYSYDKASGVLWFYVRKAVGSSALLSSWTINIAGSVGASGELGATGATGLNAALTFNYRIDLSGEQTLETEPLHQEIRFAGGVDPTTATHLLVNKNSLNLSALGLLFLSFEEGTLFLTSQSQPNTFIAYTFSQVQNGEGLFSTYVIFEIAMISQFNSLADDDLISFGIALKGATGATGAAQSFAWDLTTSSGTALTTLSINGFSTGDIPALYHVSIDGINQHAGAYTLSSGVLTFSEAVDAAAKVEIKRPKLI